MSSLPRYNISIEFKIIMEKLRYVHDLGYSTINKLKNILHFMTILARGSYLSCAKAPSLLSCMYLNNRRKSFQQITIYFPAALVPSSVTIVTLSYSAISLGCIIIYIYFKTDTFCPTALSA